MTPPKPCTCKRAKHRHGTSECHITCGCHCLPCRAAYMQMVQMRRDGTPKPRVMGDPEAWVGVSRRLEALHAIGYSGGQIAEQLGWTFQAVYRLRTRRRPVFPVTVRKVSDLYEQWWDKPYIGPGSTRTRRWAEREGFAVPMAWDDIDDPSEQPKHDLRRGALYGARPNGRADGRQDRRTA